MKKVIEDLESQIKMVEHIVNSADLDEFALKASDAKWSKKEILGHLIDSAINNLQRFTEIQFEAKPYKIRKYNQDGLVKYNDYQHARPEEILTLWKSLNMEILRVMRNQTSETLKYEVIIGRNEQANLGWLMKDYVDHMRHHVEQLKT